MKDPYSAHALNIRAKKTHPLEWLLEPLEEHPGYLHRRFFGGEAVYVNGRLCLMLIAKEKPWNGLLVITAREFHKALIADWKMLKPHEYLGKWLYLPQTHPAFESTATAIVRAVYRGDPRIGIEPKTRRIRRKGGNRPRQRHSGKKI